MKTWEDKWKFKGLFGNYFQKQFSVLQNKKRENTFDNYFLFSIIKNRKHDVFKEHLYLFSLFFRELFYKIIIQIRRMIKNKALDIKFIFKTYLKILKTC